MCIVALECMKAVKVNVLKTKQTKNLQWVGDWNTATSFLFYWPEPYVFNHNLNSN